jgi:hypothetical protein
MTNQQTNHVLGHELVHAFQYHMVIEGDSTSMRNLQNLPLWMVEGLAEYLSIGRVDAHTAMWMRDAVKNDGLPKKLRDLDSGKFFPLPLGTIVLGFCYRRLRRRNHPALIYPYRQIRARPGYSPYPRHYARLPVGSLDDYPEKSLRPLGYQRQKNKPARKTPDLRRTTSAVSISARPSAKTASM